MKTLEDVLEEITPQPDPEFAADMERRMQQGFPRPRRIPALTRPGLRLPDLRPRAWAAVAASAVLAVAVTASLVTSGDESSQDDVAFMSAPESSDSSGGAAGRSLAEPVPPAGAVAAPDQATRHVERSAQLTLAGDLGEFDDLSDSIFRVASRRGGFVLSSSFSQGEDGASGGSFDLRVPTNEIERTLNDLSRLATVRARSESANDVTAPFVSLRDRLRTAQAERKSLLRRLEVAPTDTAAAAIRRRLEIVGRKISALSAQFRAVRERTEFATVSVELVDRDAGAASSETDDAVDDSVGYLEDVLHFLIRAAGILIPIGVGALLVWLGMAYARRRARERALA